MVRARWTPPDWWQDPFGGQKQRPLRAPALKAAGITDAQKMAEAMQWGQATQGARDAIDRLHHGILDQMDRYGIKLRDLEY
jgi:hypothetical protein